MYGGAFLFIRRRTLLLVRRGTLLFIRGRAFIVVNSGALLLMRGRTFRFMCGGAFLLMIRRACFFIHSSALLLVFSRALLVLILCTDSVMTNRAFLDIHSVAHLFHLWLANILLYRATLLLIGDIALSFKGHDRLVLCVTGPVLLSFRDISSIHGEG